MSVDNITKWIGDYANQHNKSLVVGVSGGIDSAVVSTLCARTGLDTIVVSMPINKVNDLSLQQCFWLEGKYSNVTHIDINLTKIFNQFKDTFSDHTNDLALANTQARIRMTSLYQIAQVNNAIVVGTGNKVEDFGVGFFTKYGDGGVDISPIADCMKSEVWDMGRELGISQFIIDAEPTDGLWEDGRVDTDQLGLTYEQLERAMVLSEDMVFSFIELTDEEKELVSRYDELHNANLHKMRPIPIWRKHA